MDNIIHALSKRWRSKQNRDRKLYFSPEIISKVVFFGTAFIAKMAVFSPLLWKILPFRADFHQVLKFEHRSMF